MKRTRARGEHESDTELVGRDFSKPRRPTGAWRTTGAALLVGLALGGLSLASLRMTIVRTRYALADSLARETALLALERQAKVELRELRDPRRLRQLAGELGFTRPERVIELGTEALAP